jgi:hypothetical protein
MIIFTYGLYLIFSSACVCDNKVTMSSLRRFLLIIVALFLRLTLFFGFTALAFVLVFGSGDKIKEALVSTNTYTRVVDVALESAEKQTANTSTAIPFNDPEIQRIIKESFDQQTLRRMTDGVIDETYSWLNKDNPELRFKVDLSQNKERLARGVTDYAIKRFSSLPVCRNLPANTNIFQIDCQPLYVDINAQREALFNSIMSDQAFLKDAVISPDSYKDSSGNTLESKYAKAPDYFIWFKRAPWIFLFGALILMIYLIKANRTRRQGLRQIASVLVSTGIALLIAPLIASFIMPSVNNSLLGSLNGSSGSAGSIVSDVSSYMYDSLNGTLINIAIQITLAGVLIFIGLRFIRPNAPYANVKKKSGLATSVGSKLNKKGLSDDNVPLQTSERNRKSRKPSSIKRKHNKI